MSRPDSGPGPGVLVLHSWWGLTDAVKDLCDDLSARGFAALAPDMLAGVRPTTDVEAQAALALADPNVTAALLLSSTAALRYVTDDPAGPIAVIGFSSGGSWALWQAVRQPESICAVVTYYGVTDLDFADTDAPVLAHLVVGDDVVTEDLEVQFHAGMLLLDKPLTVLHYEGVAHGFAEPDAGAAYNATAAATAWDATIDFLQTFFQDRPKSSE